MEGKEKENRLWTVKCILALWGVQGVSLLAALSLSCFPYVPSSYSSSEFLASISTESLLLLFFSENHSGIPRNPPLASCRLKEVVSGGMLYLG